MRLRYPRSIKLVYCYERVKLARRWLLLIELRKYSDSYQTRMPSFGSVTTLSTRSLSIQLSESHASNDADNDDTRDDTRVDASHHDSDILSMQLRALDELESDPKRAEKIVRRLLASAVNPSDRHRWRYRLVQMLLAANRDKDAESLVAELSSDTDKLSRWVLRSLLDRDAVNPSEADAVVADAMTCEHLRIKGIVL